MNICVCIKQVPDTNEIKVDPETHTLVRKGVPIQDVAQILGHSDLRTTQVYVALDQSTVKYHYNQSVA